MAAVYRLPLVFTPEPEGSYTVTSPLLPELVTCGHDLADALAHVEDAFAAVIELYEDLGRPLPPGLRQASDRRPLTLDYIVAVP